MGTSDGSTQGREGWIRASELEGLALRLGIKKRRLADWRERGIVPHPERVGFDGRTPIWAYPPRTDHWLRSAAKWRMRTDDFQLIRLGLWIDGFNIPLDDARSAILQALDRFEEAQRRELARFAPENVTVDELLEDPDLLAEAVGRYADEVARLRGRFPVRRQVDMTLDERRRGMSYWFAGMFGLSPNPEDAIQLERILGLARGRSGNAGGLIPWPPDPVFPTSTPLTPTALRDAVHSASLETFAAARATIYSLLSVLRFLFPVLVTAEPAVRRFADSANTAFDQAPVDAFALLTATFISSIHRQHLEPEALEHHMEALEPRQILREIDRGLSTRERQDLIDLLRQQTR